jgi:hypothetical protein
VIEACQYVTNHLASEVKIEEVARHVCLSPSRVADFAPDGSNRFLSGLQQQFSANHPLIFAPAQQVSSGQRSEN